MFVIFLLLALTIVLPFLMCRGGKCVMGGGKFGESALPWMVMEMRWGQWAVSIRTTTHCREKGEFE